MSNIPIKITAEPTSDPNICKFTVDFPLSPARTINCRTKDAAQGSPLLEALFNIDGIREILISGNVITIAKLGSESWQDLGKKIGTAIRNAIESGQPLIPDDWGTKPPSENNLYQQVERILATRVNPGVSTHGGRVELVDVKGKSVYLRLSGGCQGCGAANVTLRQGIEKAIRSQLPEVTEIIDITDHASGKNPFYKTTRTDGSPL
jgi:NFU1 iron-sulfur cluster scaffold homolog, mitochondrial